MSLRRLAERMSRPSLAALVLVIVIGASFALANAFGRTDSSTTRGQTSMGDQLNRQKPTLAVESLVTKANKDNRMQQSTASTNDESSQPVNHISVKSTVSGSQSSLNVNGQDIKLPASGVLHKTIASPDGQTQVDVRVHGSGNSTTDNSSSSSLELNISSNSSSGN